MKSFFANLVLGMVLYNAAVLFIYNIPIPKTKAEFDKLTPSQQETVLIEIISRKIPKMY